MDRDNILPISISGVDHIAAFDAMVSARMDAVELETLLVYVIDTVSYDALYYLADQFGVLGFAGWKQASTEDEKREVIKQAINFQRKKGTVWAVKEAMSATGFEDARLEENIRHWAEFAIITDVGNVVDYLDDDAPLIKLVNEYKNARSHLISTGFSIVLTETIEPEEELKIARSLVSEDTIDFVRITYNGEHNYDGSVDYTGDEQEELNITIS